jgi:hypothetical protein
MPAVEEGAKVAERGRDKIGDLAIKLANAALIARERGDGAAALFFATKAAECLQLAKLLGWKGKP